MGVFWRWQCASHILWDHGKAFLTLFVPFLMSVINNPVDQVNHIIRFLYVIKESKENQWKTCFIFSWLTKCIKTKLNRADSSLFSLFEWNIKINDLKWLNLQFFFHKKLYYKKLDTAIETCLKQWTIKKTLKLRLKLQYFLFMMYILIYTIN